MEWRHGCVSSGNIDGLFREKGSDYEVELKFEDAELKNWLESYIAYEPGKALDLLVKMLPKAVAKLKEKGKEKG